MLMLSAGQSLPCSLCAALQQRKLGSKIVLSFICLLQRVQSIRQHCPATQTPEQHQEHPGLYAQAPLVPAYSALQHRQLDILKPLGLAPEDVKLPLSPRSEDAYARINEEFDLLYSQLQDPGEQAGQNHTEVTKQALCTLCSYHSSQA